MSSGKTEARGRPARALRTVPLVVAAFVVLAVLAQPVHAATTWNVEMYGEEMEQVYEFRPAVITINVGDTVNWTSTALTHSTTADAGQAEWWNSGPVTEGHSYQHTFTVPGTYNYSSLMDNNMKGAVIVVSPVPEFPGPMAFAVVAVAVALALFLERRARA